MCENLRCSCCSARELSFEASVSGLSGALLRVLFDAPLGCLLGVIRVVLDAFPWTCRRLRRSMLLFCLLKLSVRTSAQATPAMSR